MIAVISMDQKTPKLVEIIYSGLKEGSVQSTISLVAKELEKERTDKLGFTKTPLLNSLGQELGKLLLKEDWKFERLYELWVGGGRDEKLIVTSAVGEISKKDYENSKQFVLKILDDISDWEICDQLALKVVINLMLQNQEETVSLLEKWVKSENKWIRRLAIATIPPFIRARKTEFQICLSLLDKVMKEKDPDVRKAIGWALREVSKKEPKSVFDFLAKWAGIDNKNTRWIIKEGMKKLPKWQQEEIWSKW